MCFSPIISFTTFIIEFILATIFFIRDPKDRLNRIIAMISIGLGVYQLNEFLVCTTGNSIFSKLALATTAILPAFGISYALIVSRKKVNKFLNLILYSPPLFFMGWIIIYLYSQPVKCDTIFVEYPSGGIFSYFFGTYYFLYLLIAVLIFAYNYYKSNSKENQKMNLLGALSMLIFTVPTIILVIIIPALMIKFPSVLCQVALLLAIQLIFVISYKEKNKLKY